MSGAHVKRLAALKPFTGGGLGLCSGHGWPASSCASDESPLGGSSGALGAGVPSLTDLCYQRLLAPAQLSTFEEEVLCGGAWLPPTFFSDAVRLCLVQNRTLLLRLLLKHWPEPLLSLRSILPAPLGCDMQWPLHLIRVFLDGLIHVPRTLTTLDLRGFEIHDHDFLKNYKDLLCDPMSAQLDVHIHLDIHIKYANDYSNWIDVLGANRFFKIARLTTFLGINSIATDSILDYVDKRHLDSLRIKGYELTNMDMCLLETSLSSFRHLLTLDLSRHIQTVRELSIGDNPLGKNIDSVLELIKEMPQLVLLDIQDCGILESQVLLLAHYIKSHLQNLASLNMAGHLWSRDVIISSIPLLFHSSMLQTIVFPIYGLSDLHFRFKNRSDILRRQNLPQMLEPIAGMSSDFKAIENAIFALFENGLELRLDVESFAMLVVRICFPLSDNISKFGQGDPAVFVGIKDVERVDDFFHKHVSKRPDERGMD
ncbi:hypothetical protein TCAL_11575 [Tigriopus californicus]|uniref:Uncharacterized protein n=1 Tax=Tigriopus californicus TaxID=6832 RepID=A0A553N730_TIGCA|nr:hypothetical protein TCAL_11575 [Tigriopus californicus]|eukprot:TCALIF_11575-PA protein Name:"Protein of unknown function" AED:0.17 eAED:0.17 QI:206/0.6/0.5/1/0.6/0.66/6/30/482